MKFSIATPVFNGMPALRRCIGSVKGQGGDHIKSCDLSVTQDENLKHQLTVPVCVQHIVQDGGSSDGSIEFLRGFQSKVESRKSNDASNNYRLSWSSAPDGGMYDAINKAWAKADGGILSWLNADEQILPGTLQKVTDYFEKHPDMDAVFGNTIITTATGSPYAARQEIPLRKKYVSNGFLYALSCSTFYRRKLWDSGLLKLDTQYRYSADADLVLRLLSHGVQFGHVKDFFALFGVEAGKNLSFRPEMRDETAEIQKKYGSFSLPAARKAVMMFRYAERLFSGCYRAVPVRYAYAVNEVPEYCVHNNPELGFRFTYSAFKNESGQNA